MHDLRYRSRYRGRYPSFLDIVIYGYRSFDPLYRSFYDIVHHHRYRSLDPRRLRYRKFCDIVCLRYRSFVLRYRSLCNVGYYDIGGQYYDIDGQCRDMLS
jgi:hypothetical protein